MEITCPHGCGVTYLATVCQRALADLGSFEGRAWSASSYECPKCQRPTIELKAIPMGLSSQSIISFRAYPRSGRVPPPGVPAELLADYVEAASVLDLSPQASAALARRCLQAVLVNHVGATGGTLDKQIDSVKGRLPQWVAAPLHALRQIGNFAAHPIKDKNTGEIIPVESGEAEWTLDTLDALFEHVFSAPLVQAERLASLNEKLIAAGKSALEVEGLSDLRDEAEGE